jgi:hypothetical protein
MTQPANSAANTPAAAPSECWACDRPEVAYIDVLNLGWCGDCYDNDFIAPQ